MKMRLIGFALSLLTVALTSLMFCGCGNDDDSDSDQLEASDEIALQIIDQALSQDADGQWTATLITTTLTTSDTVESAGATDPGAPPDGSSSDSGEAVSYQPTGNYWFAFIDMDPFAEFSHDVLYIYTDEETGEVVVETHTWWPEINNTAIYMTDKPVMKIYAPGTPPEDYQSPGSESQTAGLFFVVEPDYDSNSVQAKLIIEASGNQGLLLNAVVDNDRDGFWGETSQGEEWLIKNEAIETDSDWYMTAAFTLPLDSNNKFAYKNWTRISASADSMDESAEWDGSDTDNPKDYYFNFLPWSGPGYDADDYSASAIGPDEPPFDPEPWDAKASWGEDAIWICEPEPIEIPTKKIALILNMGDNPGKSWMQRNARRAEMGFKLLLGDDATKMLDRPTKAEADAAVADLFSDMKCLDEVWLYVTGHGESTHGSIKAKNGGGWFRFWENLSKLNEFENCPDPNNYATNQCRQPGYCNVNLIIQSCYSGAWIDSDSDYHNFWKLGVNGLTSASADQTSYGRADGDGSFVSNAFWNGLILGLADLEANGGNGDGSVSTGEAMEYARDHHGGSSSGSTTSINANCDCECNDVPEDTTWTWTDSATDLFYWYQSGTPIYVGGLDIVGYGVSLFTGQITFFMDFASSPLSSDGTDFREYYWVFDADPAVANYDQTGPTEGADRAFIASYQSGNWYPFRFDYDGATWSGGQDPNATLDVSGNTIEYVVDNASAGLDFSEGLQPYNSATWYREGGTTDMDVGDITDVHEGPPE